MPHLETPDELAEALADLCGVYAQGIHLATMTPAESRQQEDWSADHEGDCACRMCWTGRMEKRLRTAVHNEEKVRRQARTRVDRVRLMLIDLGGALQAFVEETAAFRKEMSETTRQLTRMAEALERQEAT